ncbi:hypothetical protein [Bifidobacterium sp. UTCIF-39]|uniref:hypothetical protein n=1 Tax=Bifidobacterium sp. UTCIF-39 TaxID=1465359 RepID=UPI00112DA874|nr:hypothetical protein [Bifidobacterium sp. UTCIF-39]
MSADAYWMHTDGMTNRTTTPNMGKNKGGWNAGWGNAGKIRGRNGGFPSGGRRGGVPFKATGHKGGISRQG